MEFEVFPKIARLSRPFVVTEKIDGTNAQVVVVPEDEGGTIDTPWLASVGGFLVAAGSRNRFITPAADNHGWAAWVLAHAEEVAMLGPGRHFGEWWGSGIQRGYGLPKGEKRFSLFNVSRWALSGTEPAVIPTGDPSIEKRQQVLPPCCGLVPVLARGEQFDSQAVDVALARLSSEGSVAAPGFLKPEGVVVFHVAGNVMFKKTLEKDDEPKGRVTSHR